MQPWKPGDPMEPWNPGDPGKPSQQTGYNGFTSDMRLGPMVLEIDPGLPTPRCSICKKRMNHGDVVFLVPPEASQTGRPYGWHAECDPDSLREARAKQREERAKIMADIEWLCSPEAWVEGMARWYFGIGPVDERDLS